MSAASPVKRGCGTRKKGGVYLECGHSPFGAPVEAFLFDPPLKLGIPDEWMKPNRSPQLFEREGVTHVVIWVGSEFYPNLFDFVEEVRVAGASRRVPSTFDFSKLSSESRMYFVHAHALVDGATVRDYVVARNGETLPGVSFDGCNCPRLEQDQRRHTFATTDEAHATQSQSCLGLAKYLPTSDAHDYKTETNQTGRTRVLPCGHRYELAAERELSSSPAVFMHLPLTAITCVTKSDGSFNDMTEARVRSSRGVHVIKTDK